MAYNYPKPPARISTETKGCEPPAIFLLSAATGVIFLFTHHWLVLSIFIISTFFLLISPFHFRDERLRISKIATEFNGNPKYGFLVLGGSTRTSSYIVQNWLPLFENKIEILKWSEKEKW